MCVCVCIFKAERVCCVFRGFPWGDSAVLWAWASHPITMDHCLALTEGENMCMYVWIYVSVCICNQILKEWADWCERKAAICVTLGAGRRANAHTHTHTLKLLHFKSVLTVCSVAWRARFNVEPLAVSTAGNLRSVLLNQKKIRRDNSKRKTRGTLCSNGNTIQIKWHKLLEIIKAG